MKNLIIGIAILAFAAFAWTKKNKFMPISSITIPSDVAVSQFTDAICKTEILPKIVDAYPQSKMTSEELKKQTLGEGMERLQQFQVQLPKLLDPIAVQFKKDQTGWKEIQKLVQEFNQLSQRGSRKSNFSPMQNFATNVKNQIKTRCPASVPNSMTDQNAEFAVGAIVGYLGSK